MRTRIIWADLRPSLRIFTWANFGLGGRFRRRALLGWNSSPEIAEFRWNTSFGDNHLNGTESTESFWGLKPGPMTRPLPQKMMTRWLWGCNMTIGRSCGRAARKETRNTNALWQTGLKK